MHAANICIATVCNSNHTCRISVYSGIAILGEPANLEDYKNCIKLRYNLSQVSYSILG